jgi:hypothetical protein
MAVLRPPVALALARDERVVPGPDPAGPTSPSSTAGFTELVKAGRLGSARMCVGRAELLARPAGVRPPLLTCWRTFGVRQHESH